MSTEALDPIAAAEQRGYRRAGADIAERIRAELVCCDIFDQDAGTNRAGRTHGICFWGEASARLAEDAVATGDLSRRAQVSQSQRNFQAEYLEAKDPES